MNSKEPPAIWSGLALALLALAGGLRPAWGAPLPDGRSATEFDPSSCCVDPETGGCCPGDEGREPEPSYLPLCCGVDEA
ncbi:MAG: hypothetical protein L0Y66_26160, partial [Myxococcaceae bacterium]|nr:hypothetical protein [Myxococcaceae bacterium]